MIKYLSMKLFCLLFTASIALSMETQENQEIQKNEQNSNQLVMLNTQWSSDEDLGDMQHLNLDVMLPILSPQTFNLNELINLRLVCKSFNWCVSKQRALELQKILNNKATLDPFSLTNEVFLFDKYEDSRIREDGQLSLSMFSQPLDFFLMSVSKAIDSSSILLKRIASSTSTNTGAMGYVFSVDTWRGTVPEFEVKFVPKDIVQFGRTHTDYGPSGNFTSLLVLSIKSL